MVERNTMENLGESFVVFRGIDSIRGIIAQEIERHTLK